MARSSRHGVGYRRVLARVRPSCGRRFPERRRRRVAASRQPGFFRKPYGPGWALVGDAGYFKDPITAHGISDALRDAELLARAVVRGTDRALAEYESTRDELSLRLFEITDAIAAFGWDLESLKPLHLDLSKTMNHEVEALLGLDA
jgi:flavin-dependent dehydrogenase